MPKLSQIILWGIFATIVLGIAYVINSDTNPSSDPAELEEGGIFEGAEFGNISSEIDEGTTSFDEIDDPSHVPPSPGGLVPGKIISTAMSWVDIRKTNIWVQDDWLWVKITVVEPAPKHLGSAIRLSEAEIQAVGGIFALTDEMLTWRIRIDYNNDNKTDYTIDAVWNPTGKNLDQQGRPKDDLTGGYFSDLGGPKGDGAGRYQLGNNEFPGIIGTHENTLLTGFPLEMLPMLGTEFELAVCVNYTGDHELVNDFILATYDCDPDVFPPGAEWIQVKL